MYNIGAVARMTNILEATLRVWERRYQFPQATRTSGGHRLYSPEDVARLQWVKARMDEGMHVSHAIRALQQAEAEGTFHPRANLVPPHAMPTGPGSPEDVPPTSRPTHPAEAVANPSLLQAQHALLDALKRHDLEQAGAILAGAQAYFALEEIVLEIVGPTFYEIGAAWERGEVDVATEHLATNYLRSHLTTWMRVSPPPLAVNPVLLACAPGELHEGSLLMLGVLLRRLRWPVLYLGQTVPMPELAVFVEEANASILLFVAMTYESAVALLGWPRWLPEVAAAKKPLVCYGGRAFVEHPELCADLQGLYLGDTLAEGIQRLDHLLHQLNPHLH